VVGWVGITHVLNGTPIKRSSWKYCLAVIKFADLGCWWVKLCLHIYKTDLVFRETPNWLKAMRGGHCIHWLV